MGYYKGDIMIQKEKVVEMVKSISPKTWIILLIIIIVFAGWKLGAVGSGMDFTKKIIFGHYEEVIKQLKLDRDVLEEKLKQNQNKIIKQDKSIAEIKIQNIDMQRRLQDVEKRKAEITIPSKPNDLIDEFRALGFSSARASTRTQ